MKTIHCFLITVAAITIFPVLKAQDITGDWYGKNQTPDSLHITLHIYKDRNGLNASIDSPDEGNFGSIINEVKLEKDSLFYRITGFDITFKGRFNRDYSIINGSVTQFGNRWGLDFGRKRLKRIVPVNYNSLTVIPAKVRVIKTGDPQKIPYEGIRIVEAGNPKVIDIETSKLKVLIPGKGAVLNPIVYKFPESITKDEFPVKKYYPQFAPVVVRAKSPTPVQVQPMRMKDAATFNIKYLGAEQGLINPRISSIMEDTKGNMWFGSFIGGACRYDGKSLFYYPGTEWNTSIIEDRKGNIWLGTDWGLWKFDGKSIVKYPGEVFNYIRSMLESRNGNLWIGTENGVFERKGDIWIHYTENQGLTGNAVMAITEDRCGNLWFGTQTGACKFDGVSFTHFTEKEGLISNIIRSVIEDKNGNLWFGTSRGACKYDGKSFRQYTVNEGLSHNDVYSIKEDFKGDIWFGTFGGGVTVYDGKSFTHFTEKEGLSSNYIISVTEDKSRNIWLTTNGNGVMKLSRNSFTYLTQFENIGQGNITSISEDRKGNIWFGVFGAGLVKFDDVSLTLIRDNEDLRDIFPRSMLVDKSGNIWFADHNLGLQKYDGKSFTLFNDTESPVNYIGSMHEDNAGNLWLAAGDYRLKKFDGKSFTWFPEITGGSEVIMSVLQDNKENIWYGSLGLFKYDGKSITQYNINEGLSDMLVYSLYTDEPGNIWIGTLEHGVNKFNGDTFTYFTDKEGLINNHVRSIIGDNKGNIWIGTLKSLSLLSPLADGNYSVNSVGTEDDLKNLSFNSQSVCLDSRNRLWWGTGDIITMLDLNTFEIIPETPAIQLNDIQINQEYIDFGALLTGDKKSDQSSPDTSTSIRMRGLRFSDVIPFYNYPVDLVLPHHLNHITFNFSAISWTAPQSIRYQYMLEGMDEEWSQLSKDNKADYRNIPAGEYKFRVKALNRTNVWSETFEYPFTVRPPWWLRWWVYAFYAIVLILLIGYYIRFRIGRERIKSEMRIKQVEVEKMQELDQMKSRFFANISHEFRTPLTLLISPINDLLKNRQQLKEDDRKLLNIMKRNAGRLQKLINQLLDLSKLETGNLKLEVSEGDMTGFIKTIVLSFLSLAESKKINYRYDLQETPGACFFDEDKIEKITTNLISNALKFTGEGGSVIVALLYSMESDAASVTHAEIKVKDTGPGIPDNEKEKIFDRFYQVSSSDTSEHEGSGIGLALTKEITVLYRGNIRVDSETGKGSTFIVRLPVSREQFREDEIVAVSKMPAEPKIFDVHEIPVYEAAEYDVRNETGKEIDKDKPAILIVEDNMDLRNYISGNLSGHYQILEAENGEKGLNIAIENIPDLVISDLMMPEMGGVEMCERLKKDSRTNHIPLIMLTARADRESKLESLETGADDYIIKPFDAEELQVRVKNLIEQRKKLREHYRKEFLTDPADHEIPPPEDEFLVRFMDCAKKHLKDPNFSVEQLGKELHLSRVQLYRKVLSLTDCTPSEFMRNIRLKTAARMFLDGHRNITSVLYSVGYSTPSHFTQSFRELFGVNPSEYIKQNSKAAK